MKKIVWIIIIIIIVAVAIFIKLGDIKGESTDDANNNQNKTELSDTTDQSEELENSNEEDVPGDNIDPANNTDVSDNTNESPTPPIASGPNRQIAVTYTDDGFVPEQVEIRAGDSVVFVNESSRDFWPASDIHPTHTVYPNSDIEKCFDGSDTGGLFDSCGNIAPGESWSFVFSEVGTWNYHNHNRANEGGTVVVSEFVGQ